MLADGPILVEHRKGACYPCWITGVQVGGDGVRIDHAAVLR